MNLLFTAATLTNLIRFGSCRASVRYPARTRLWYRTLRRSIRSLGRLIRPKPFFASMSKKASDRGDPAGREPAKLFDPSDVDTIAVALISKCGIQKTVAKNNLSFT